MKSNRGDCGNTSTIAGGHTVIVSEAEQNRIQAELEKTCNALSQTTDLDERKMLLRKMKRLIEDAERLALESES